jgi:hypothetical protein
MRNDLGIKTIFDLRNEHEANLACAHARAKADKLLRSYQTLYPAPESSDGKKDEDRDRPPKPQPFLDFRGFFFPVVLKTPFFSSSSGGIVASKATLTRAGQPSTEAMMRSSRVTVSVDFGSRAVVAMTAYWVLLAAALLTLLWQFERAARLVIKQTVQRIGVLQLYQSIVDHQHGEIRQVMEALSQPSNYPVVVCCSLGKDRTGIVAMLVLSILGASDDAIAEDFARTTGFMTSGMKKAQKKMGLGEEWNVARRETMLALIAYIRRAGHGSVESFLVERVKVPKQQLERIRSILIEG